MTTGIVNRYELVSLFTYAATKGLGQGRRATSSVPWHTWWRPPWIPASRPALPVSNIQMLLKPTRYS